jgi:iron-sulfur cluster assembly protein
VTPALYSERVLELFRALPGAGAPGSGPGRLAVGEAGSPERGAWVRFEARVDSGRIVDCGFRAWGCPHTLAAAAVARTWMLASQEGGSPQCEGAARRGRSGTISAMAITLTPAAADRVRHFLTERGHGVGLRLGIRKTGCSGYAYVVNYADAVEAGDRVFDSEGVRVLVDADSLKLIDGTVVDFVRQGLNESFRFRNPNVRGECGCGESFSI